MWTGLEALNIVLGLGAGRSCEFDLHMIPLVQPMIVIKGRKSCERRPFWVWWPNKVIREQTRTLEVSRREVKSGSKDPQLCYPLYLAFPSGTVIA